VQGKHRPSFFYYGRLYSVAQYAKLTNLSWRSAVQRRPPHIVANWHKTLQSNAEKCDLWSILKFVVRSRQYVNV
jgi:hypothetical protein